jgi:hypothetical protein
MHDIVMSTEKLLEEKDSRHEYSSIAETCPRLLVISHETGDRQLPSLGWILVAGK